MAEEIPEFIKRIMDAFMGKGSNPPVLFGFMVSSDGNQAPAEIPTMDEINEDHERWDALQESIARTGETDIFKLGDADRLRQVAYRLLLYGMEAGDLCVHRDHNPVAWELVRMADRLELLDAGVAES